MTTISHEPSRAKSDRPWTKIVVRETWVSLAISVIWLSVLFDAIYGPNIVTSSAGGSDSAVVPSAVVVSIFAFLATWVVAKYGLRDNRD
jgi:hypothetical protein